MKEKKSRKKLPLILGIIFGVLAVAACVLALIFGR